MFTFIPLFAVVNFTIINNSTPSFVREVAFFIIYAGEQRAYHPNTFKKGENNAIERTNSRKEESLWNSSI